MPHRTHPSLLCDNLHCVALVTTDFHSISLNQEHVCPSELIITTNEKASFVTLTPFQTRPNKKSWDQGGRVWPPTTLFQITTVRCFHSIDSVACDPHVLDLSLTQA